MRLQNDAVMLSDKLGAAGRVRRKSKLMRSTPIRQVTRAVGGWKSGVEVVGTIDVVGDSSIRLLETLSEAASSR